MIKKDRKYMIKSVTDIRDEFFDNGNNISKQSMQDLIWHIENDPLPTQAISLVTDARFMELVPLIAKHLNHADDYVREFTIGCLVRRMHLPEYAEEALRIAQDEPDGSLRTIAISSLGAVLNQVDDVLKNQMADHLYRVLISNEYDKLDKRCAFDSILQAMGMPIPQQITTSYDLNHDLVKQFTTKYELS